MDKRLHPNKGFTLIEVIFCLFIMTTLGILTIPIVRYEPKPKKDEIASEIYSYQMQSMLQKQTFPLSINKQETSFTYNNKGNINHGGRFDSHSIHCIFQLGAGRFRFE